MGMKVKYTRLPSHDTTPNEQPLCAMWQEEDDVMLPCECGSWVMTKNEEVAHCQMCGRAYKRNENS